jgi:RibD domain-containing protein
MGLWPHSSWRVAAGNKNVGISGGANIMRQYLKAGLLDEMQIHLILVLLGSGVRLFEDLDPEGIELRSTSSIDTPSATHSYVCHPLIRAPGSQTCPRQDSNLRTALRRRVLYPLSYGGLA